MITITDQAAAHLRELLTERGSTDPAESLRIFVDKGGCSGWQYNLQFDRPQPGDECVRRADGAQVLVAADSAASLAGSVLDYEDGLTGAGFRIHNPKAVRTCGCGSSFEIAAGAPAGAGTHGG